MDAGTPSEMWLLAEEVTVVEAALLLLSIEPHGAAHYVERNAEENQPLYYRAAKQAVMSAIINEQVSGLLVTEGGYPVEQFDFISYDGIDPSLSRLNLQSLRDWLERKGVHHSFFAAQKTSLDLLDESNPRFAPKLAAAVEAWQNFSDVENDKGTVKQRLLKWLRINASRFGLVGDDGSPSETVIEDIAKIANWETTGGVPKIAQRKSDPD